MPKRRHKGQQANSQQAFDHHPKQNLFGSDNQNSQRQGTGRQMTTTTTQMSATTNHGNRWLQLVLGLICMMAISSPQYVWAGGAGPRAAARGGGRAGGRGTGAI